MPHKDPARAKEYERQRYHRRTTERRAQGLCPKCGKEPPEPERSLCTPCAEKKRKAARARYAKGKAEGMLYGGRNVETRRRNARARDRRYRKAWREANLCTRCGKHPGGEGGTVCEPCKETRRMAERQQYAARRAAGRCGKCGHPAFNGVSRCGPCSAVEAEYNPIRNEAGRKRYAQLRARGLCTDCGQPSHGAARCEECARRSYVRSGSAFSMTGNDEGGGSAAFWGRGALSRFDGQDGDMTLIRGQLGDMLTGATVRPFGKEVDGAP